jgi:DNA segregation ATPase FtsK/SpoIIIE-like protein
LAYVEIVRRDPFLPLDGQPAALAWPWLDRDRARLWESVPVGVDELGETVSLDLPERGVLVGGEPGSGKSAGLSQLLAAAALDPWCHIWGLDAKRLELALWRPVLDRVAYGDMADAITLVEDLIDIMNGRYEELERLGLRKIHPGYELYVLAVDELRFYTAHHDRKARERFNGLMIDLEARGRAAGIIPLKATQKPSTDVVPSSLRDLSAVRWAMRCNTRDASDTILGAGWASLGYSAADIDVRTRGVGWLLSEGGFPRRVLSYYLTDDHIRTVAARGAALRREVAASAH